MTNKLMMELKELKIKYKLCADDKEKEQMKRVMIALTKEIKKDMLSKMNDDLDKIFDDTEEEKRVYQKMLYEKKMLEAEKRKKIPVYDKNNILMDRLATEIDCHLSLSSKARKRTPKFTDRLEDKPRNIDALGKRKFL
jgi:hypothetical protein